MNTQKIKPFLVILLCLAFQMNSFAQSRTKIDRIDLKTIAIMNQGSSYITTPLDFGNIEKLWFEADIKPNFYIHKSENSKLMAVLSPEIIIRMYREPSFPVRTPSFKPAISVYYLLYHKHSATTLSAFGKVAHHSNGQEDDFYLVNGDVNLRSGNFSTNHMELGLIQTSYLRNIKLAQYFRTSIDLHAKYLSSDELDGTYSFHRWHNMLYLFRLPDDNLPTEKKKPNLSLKLETTWLFDDIWDWEKTSFQRLNYGITLYYKPDFLEDLGFFTTFYHGMDYYNIYYRHKLNMLRFGIMTEKLRF